MTSLKPSIRLSLTRLGRLSVLLLNRQVRGVKTKIKSCGGVLRKTVGVTAIAVAIAVITPAGQIYAQELYPSFRANVSSDQTVTTNTTVLVNWDQEDFDTSDSFDLTNDKFVAPSDGYYLVSLQIRCGGTGSANDGCLVQIYKNGTQITGSTNAAFNLLGNDVSMGVSTAVIFLSTNDYLEFKGNNVQGTTFQGNSAHTQTMVSGHKIFTGTALPVDNQVLDIYLGIILFFLVSGGLIFYFKRNGD